MASILGTTGPYIIHGGVYRCEIICFTTYQTQKRIRVWIVQIGTRWEPCHSKNCIYSLRLDTYTISIEMLFSNSTLINMINIAPVSCYVLWIAHVRWTTYQHIMSCQNRAREGGAHNFETRTNNLKFHCYIHCSDITWASRLLKSRRPTLCSTVCPGLQQIKHKTTHHSSFVRKIHRGCHFYYTVEGRYNAVQYYKILNK